MSDYKELFYDMKREYGTTGVIASAVAIIGFATVVAFGIASLQAWAIRLVVRDVWGREMRIGTSYAAAILLWRLIPQARTK